MTTASTRVSRVFAPPAPKRAAVPPASGPRMHHALPAPWPQGSRAAAPAASTAARLTRLPVQRATAPIQMVPDWMGRLGRRIRAPQVGGPLAGIATAAALAATPLGWGIALGAGVGATVLAATGLAAARARRRQRYGGDGFPRMFADARAGRLPRQPLEQAAHDWDENSYQRIGTAAGSFSVRPGRANQPFIQSRKEDYGNASVDVDYDAVADELSDDETTPDERRARAANVLNLMKGKPVNLHGTPHRVRRAMVHLAGITQVAEEHRTRTPGSARMGRAAVRAIRRGAGTFHGMFRRADGLYLPARHGGTGMTREVAAGARMPDAALVDLMRDHGYDTDEE